eukprot:GHRR01006736.1.p1 GENE.GHRR01006736.1~~GHRR01006736.1.p1  ORF type:complete len:221 (+),score=62.08 GHRR01006736.1:151-813(+)
MHVASLSSRVSSRQVTCCKVHNCPCAAKGQGAAPARVQAETQRQASSNAELQSINSLIEQHGNPSDDIDLTARETMTTFSYLQQSGKLLSETWQIDDLTSRALQMTDLLATGSTFRTLHILKRHPGLLKLQPQLVAERVLQLKLTMPAANVAELLYQKPALLLIDDIPGALTPVLNKLHALMPGIPIEKKLHEGGTVFWSFSDLLNANSLGQTAAARQKQ